MSDKIKVRLLKPLDGMPEGAETEFDKLDAERLKGLHAVAFVRVAAAPANKSASPPMKKA